MHTGKVIAAPVSASGRRPRLGTKPARDYDTLRRAQEGDAQAFETLYERHKPRVYRLCLRMVKNEALAEDLTQETFLQVFRKLHTFRREAAFTTWLHRVTANTVFMHLRKRKLPSVSIEELEQADSVDQSSIAELGKEDASLRSCVDRLTLRGELMKISRGYRMVLSLHDIMGYRHPEIARKLGCSVGNSKSQLHKARLRLRTNLLAVRDEPQTKAAA